MAIKRIMAKLGNMRKEADFVVYPNRGGDADNTKLLIQSDHRICEFDPTTGKGMLSKNKSHACFADLMPFLGAMEVIVPADVIAAAIDAKPKSGDRIGANVFIA